MLNGYRISQVWALGSKPKFATCDKDNCISSGNHPNREKLISLHTHIGLAAAVHDGSRGQQYRVLYEYFMCLKMTIDRAGAMILVTELIGHTLTSRGGFCFLYHGRIITPRPRTRVELVNAAAVHGRTSQLVTTFCANTDVV